MFEKEQAEQPQEPQIAAIPQAQLTADDEEKHRPPNAFILFERVMRQEIAIHNPDLPIEDVSIGRLWQLADEDTRNIYRQQALELREIWQQLHPGEPQELRRRKTQSQPMKAAEPIRIRVILEGDILPALPKASDVEPLLVPRLDEKTNMPTQFQ